MKLLWGGLGASPSLSSLTWTTNPGDADLIVRHLDKTSIESPKEILTPRENEILSYLVDGWSNDEIADRLKITKSTVKFHLRGLYQHLGVTRRTEAVREGLLRGLIQF